jgi:hypothetical protein
MTRIFVDMVVAIRLIVLLFSGLRYDQVRKTRASTVQLVAKNSKLRRLGNKQTIEDVGLRYTQPTINLYFLVCGITRQEE